jgi:hypothetical protein
MDCARLPRSHAPVWNHTRLRQPMCSNRAPGRASHAYAKSRARSCESSESAQIVCLSEACMAHRACLIACVPESHIKRSSAARFNSLAATDASLRGARPWRLLGMPAQQRAGRQSKRKCLQRIGIFCRLVGTSRIHSADDDLRGGLCDHPGAQRLIARWFSQPEPHRERSERPYSKRMQLVNQCTQEAARR